MYQKRQKVNIDDGKTVYQLSDACSHCRTDPCDYGPDA